MTMGGKDPAHLCTRDGVSPPIAVAASAPECLSGESGLFNMESGRLSRIHCHCHHYLKCV